ncbi:hypothetical protein SARC_02030 [Sphaeroforma arctica JP610]|uniref:Chromodomain-helicase-DNA-binding protein 1 n=1 Tax=Sphaeroforma arctica JP610 TaxID=667725 RepID=A0A0L0G9X6_9EUKA|nr:hypothetical protein SARC_02030 [Sphaeroforma arctica JP610]KNC85805.1 hypothetical protein SARC_02030 [Sphaeroforma arctica JP610]|eukprot:XP_014159707.1 hypothetical protein SARC_02030 [Sphaeroforma arctica JP610]
MQLHKLCSAEDGEEIEDTRPNIDKILGKKLGSEMDDIEDDLIGGIPLAHYSHKLSYNGKQDKEASQGRVYYNIKWQGRSHRHNTWNSAVQLKTAHAGQGVKGLGKLQNYITEDTNYSQWLQTAPKEEVEYAEVERQMIASLNLTHTRLERVVAERTVYASDDGLAEEVDEDDSSYDEDRETKHMFLCKWEGLPYEECTWEYEDEIANDQHLVDAFLDREEANTLPTPNCAALKKRPKFKELKTQPNYIGKMLSEKDKKLASDAKETDEEGPKELIMRDYQLEGLNWIVHNWCQDHSAILADEMGLGKTIQAFDEWTPDLNVITYLGNKQSRKIIRDHEFYTSTANRKKKYVKFNVLLTSYEIVSKDASVLLPFKWASLLVDEAHRLKNHESQLHNVLASFSTNHRLLVTGTPLQNSLKELWALLKFIEPGRFPTWEDFEDEFGTDLQSSKIVKLQDQELKQLMIRRVKKDVEKSLPNKVERILSVNMGSLQREYYRHIINKNYSVLRKGNNRGTLLNTMIEMKKCCNHPFLVKEPEFEDTNTGDMTASERNIDRLNALVKNSGKLVLLDKLLMRLKETGHRVLIFSQMVRMLDIISEYLRLRGFIFQRLDGCTKNEQRKQAMDHFNAPGSVDFCFILSTRAGGLGINLATADTVIIFDSDWNPQNDLQAEARAHRIGQKKVVNIYRLVTKDSVEENVLKRAKQKLVLDHVVIQSMDSSGHAVVGKRGKDAPNFDKTEISQMMKVGAESLYEEDGDSKATKNLEEMDLDAILSRADVLAEEEDRSATAEFLSQFNTVSFVQDEKEWEDIIPEHAMDKILEDEKTRQFEEEEKERYALITFGSRERKPVVYADAQAEAAVATVKNKAKAKDTKAPAKGSLDSEAMEEGDAKKMLRGVRKYPNIVCRIDDIADETNMTNKNIAGLQEMALMYMADFDRVDEQLNGEPTVTPTAPNGTDGDKNAAALPNEGYLTGVGTRVLQELGRRDRDSCLLGQRLSNFQRFRLHNMRGVQKWNCKWGVADDARLMFGVYKWGFNNWETIKDDPECEMADKVLQDDVPPQTSHLQQRGMSLLKHLSHTQTKPQVKTTTTATAKSKKTVKKTVSRTSSTMPDDKEVEFIAECKKTMYDVRKHLKAMGKLSAKATHSVDLSKDPELIKHLLVVGDHITRVVSAISSEADRATTTQRLWTFSANYHPIEDPKKLQDYYMRKSGKSKVRSDSTSISKSKSKSKDKSRGTDDYQPHKQSPQAKQTAHATITADSHAADNEHSAKRSRSRDRSRSVDRSRSRSRERHRSKRSRSRAGSTLRSRSTSRDRYATTSNARDSTRAHTDAQHRHSRSPPRRNLRSRSRSRSRSRARTHSRSRSRDRANYRSARDGEGDAEKHASDAERSAKHLSDDDMDISDRDGEDVAYDTAQDTQDTQHTQHTQQDSATSAREHSHSPSGAQAQARHDSDHDKHADSEVDAANKWSRQREGSAHPRESGEESDGHHTHTDQGHSPTHTHSPSHTRARERSYSRSPRAAQERAASRSPQKRRITLSPELRGGSPPPIRSQESPGRPRRRHGHSRSLSPSKPHRNSSPAKHGTGTDRLRDTSRERGRSRERDRSLSKERDWDRAGERSRDRKRGDSHKPHSHRRPSSIDRDRNSAESGGNNRSPAKASSARLAVRSSNSYRNTHTSGTRSRSRSRSRSRMPKRDGKRDDHRYKEQGRSSDRAPDAKGEESIDRDRDDNKGSVHDNTTTSSRPSERGRERERERDRDRDYTREKGHRRRDSDAHRIRHRTSGTSHDC